MESTLPATYSETLPTIFRTVGDLDAFDRAAATRPLGLVVAATMQAAARSEHTRRAYTTGIGYFLTFLDATVGDQVPTDWRPFAQAGKESEVVRGRTVTRTVWAYNGPAAVLRLVDAGTLDAFRAWRESEGDSPNTASSTSRQCGPSRRSLPGPRYRDRSRPTDGTSTVRPETEAG